MTLDEAEAAYESCPSNAVVGEFLETLLGGWTDGLIEDEAFIDGVARVARNLKVDWVDFPPTP
jgi:hypothetical protein